MTHDEMATPKRATKPVPQKEVSAEGKQMTNHITVKLPIVADSLQLHTGMARCTHDGHEVTITSGFGLGNATIHVAVDGHRRLSVDATPLLAELTRAALAAEPTRAAS